MGRGALDDRELVERAKRRDVGAYAALVERYQDLAFRTALLIVGDPAEAEDAAQAAFVKAYYALARFRADLPLRPWLLKIVANEARNRRRAATRRFALSLRAADDSLVSRSTDLPEELALEREEQEELLDALECLREEDRQVIAHRYFLDLSEGEMAEVLGCPRGTVKSRLSRALERLRVALSARRTQGVGETSRREMGAEDGP